MKIKNIAIIILMTMFLIIFGIKVEATTGTVTEDDAKLRKEPDSKVVLDLLDKGLDVEILEEQAGWYKVKAKTSLGKVTGYVSKDVLEVENNATTENIQDKVETPVETPKQNTVKIPEETQPSQETTPVVTTDVEMENIQEDKQYTLTQEVAVRILPSMSSREKCKINGSIQIIETINDWSRIESDTAIGWIRTNTLEEVLKKTETPVQQEPEEQPEETTQEEAVEKEPEPIVTEESDEPEITKINKTGYVKAEGLRVRKGPSTDTEEITSLSQNDEVKVIGQTGNWYKIDLNGKTGYVSAKYISDTKIVETTSRSGSTLKNEQVTEQKQEETPVVEEMPVKEIPVEETPVVEETSTSGTTGSAIVEYAKQYLGHKYVSGGSSPSKGFDCSGFTTYIYKHFGISLYRSSSAQIKNGVAVEKNNLQLGDLVIFNNDANTKIGHVGIYVGNGNFIHASNPKDGVKITTLTSGYYHQRYVGARRVH